MRAGAYGDHVGEGEEGMAVMRKEGGVEVELAASRRRKRREWRRER